MPTGGELELVSLEPPERTREIRFKTAVYRAIDRNTLQGVLIREIQGEIREAMVLRMFWSPRAGQTPVDPNATNVTLHYMILGDESLGVYRGAGFVYPRDAVGDDTLILGLWRGYLELDQQAGPFRDALGRAELEGLVKLRRDDAATATLTRRLNQRLADRLPTARPVFKPRPGSVEPSFHTDFRILARSRNFE